MYRGFALLFALTLASCGGGATGGTPAVNAPPLNGAPSGGPSSAPTAEPSNAPSTAPSNAPSTGSTMIADTTGRVGLFQEFDRLMSPAQIVSDAPRYDAVWGASQPQLWLGAHPGMVVSRYFIPQEDRSQLSGHDLNWWQTNHPDWILYACRSNGTPTHDYAWWPGVDAPDVPLDFHNPDVIDYQVRQLNGQNAIQNGDNALAIDQVIFQDAMVGGNPNFGQTSKPGEYACGVWSNGAFVRRYSSASDPAWTADMLAFVTTARRIVTTDPELAPHHLKIIVNHPQGSIGDPNEQALLGAIDGFVDERGYADYGRYAASTDAARFNSLTKYLIYLQKRGIAVFIINYFKDAAVTPQQREYAVAAYFMANEGGADLFITPSTGGMDNNFPEYGTRLRAPCEEYHGGPFMYYRRYSGGLVVLNSGSLPALHMQAALPANHNYTDVDGRKITNPLDVASNDGYVLLTSNGCS